MKATLKSYITKEKRKIDKELFNLFTRKKFPKELVSPTKYALHGGKRLRPLLTLLIVDMIDPSISEKALLPACAIECIHTASLIHDDLPCMDNDDFRRGRPSLHRAFPESIATLTGDFLFIYPFEILSNAPHLSDMERLKLISLLAQFSGGNHLIGGQIKDITTQGKELSWNTIQDMYHKKTTCLFELAVQFGSILTKSTAPQQQLLQKIARHFGLAFQLQDDLKDSILDPLSGKHQKMQNRWEKQTNAILQLSRKLKFFSPLFEDFISFTLKIDQHIIAH